jgi:hypothetical protein
VTIDRIWDILTFQMFAQKRREREVRREEGREMGRGREEKE